MQDDIQVEPLLKIHWPDVQRIYREGLATRNATFETEVPEWDSWNRLHRKECRLVAISGKHIAGWAALSNYSPRKVYSGVAEVSIYIDPDFQGQGIGGMLLKKLIMESEKAGVWTLQASVFPENISSIKLHEKCGFHKVGTREKIAQLNGKWRDVILLERRK